jgi:hypothetical protein
MWFYNGRAFVTIDHKQITQFHEKEQHTMKHILVAVGNGNVGEIQMTNRTGETSPLVYARVAGLLYLLVAISGDFSFFFG